MSSSTKRKDTSEVRVRTALEKEFDNDFNGEKLKVGKKLNGKDSLKRFDAVSKDQQTVEMVKNYSAHNKAGNRTRLARVLQDMVYLYLSEPKRKFMYLSPEFYDWMEKEANDGSVLPGIKVRPIPQEE